MRSSLAALELGVLEDRAHLLTAYLGGALGVGAVTCLAFGALLLLRRLADRPGL